MIKDMKHRDNLRYVAQYYGLDAQIDKTVEELDELRDAIQYRKFGGEGGIFEEMADVSNMIEQISYLLNARESVQQIAARKMERQIARIRRGQE